MSGLRLPSRTPFGSTPSLAALALCAGLVAVTAGAASAYTVSSRTDYPTGTNPIAAASADFDGDGDRDLVVANFGGNSVTLRVNDGSGAFGAPTTLAVGPGPYDVAFVDLNADYYADIVTVNYWSNTISVLINNTTGGFFPNTEYVVGANPTGLAVRDVNGDGSPDIVAVNYWLNTVSVVFNNGLGAFGTPTSFATAAGPENVALGDIDGDGDADLVTCNIGANSVSVLKNDGSGSFGAATNYPTGLFPYFVALADVNNDGNLDVVSANYTDSSVSVLLGSATGAFSPRTDYPAGPGTNWLKVVDVDFDRKLDIVTSDYDGPGSSVLKGDGAGAFTLERSFAVGAGAWGMTAADFSGDGIVDIAVAGYDVGTASVLIGDLPGGFAIGDTATAFKALDQNGVERSLAEFAGKWVFLDLMSAWCGPCNAMGNESQQVYDTWASGSPLPFEYLTAMVQGSDPSKPSNQTNAQRWRCRYNISRPILQADGKYPNTIDSYFAGIDGVAFPTLTLIDPQGIVRWKLVGSLTGQQVVDTVAALAGVPTRTLAPPPASLCGSPPPPTPEGGVRSVWFPLSQANLHITYDGVECTSVLGGTYDQDPVTRFLSFDQFDFSPGGVPQPYGQVYASVDSVTGIESVAVAFLRTDGYAIETAHPYSVKLTDMAWPDGLARSLVQPTSTLVQTVYIENNDIYGAQTGFGVPYSPPLSLAGSQLDVGAFDLSSVPGMPPAPWAWQVSNVNFQHANALDVPSGGAGSGRLLMGSPWPNPASTFTSLRYALPKRERVRIEIVDVSGRRVRQLHDGELDAGAQVTNWDLTDDGGRRVNAGVFFARIQAGGETAVRRVAVVK